MSKTTAQQIINAGFNKEMFSIEDETEFNTFLTGIIAERAAILEGRIGSTLYAASTSPNKERVLRAELCLSIAEVIQIRINHVLRKEMRGGHDTDILKEGTQKKIYQNEAEELIAVLVAERTTDSPVSFASGALVTTHF